MALFHLSVTQTKRSAGQSAIASAAYRAGARLYSEYYGEYSDYTRKGGVICSDILLPSHAPPEYADRQTLWNAVEKAERGKNAQLAYSFDIALQNEFSLEENIALARQLRDRSIDLSLLFIWLRNALHGILWLSCRGQWVKDHHAAKLQERQRRGIYLYLRQQRQRDRHIPGR